MSKKQYHILIIFFLVMGIGTTFAYFTNLNIATESGKSQVSSVRMEILTFQAGNPLSFNATEENFGENMEDLMSTTISTANLQAASDNRLATYYYNVDLVIDKNDFDYTISDSNAELLLVVKDPNGDDVEHIDNLKYVEVNGKKGFDITKAQGTYKIATKYKIETTTEVSQNWTASIIFVNYKESQDANKNKTLNGRISIYEEKGEKA